MLFRPENHGSCPHGNPGGVNRACGPWKRTVRAPAPRRASCTRVPSGPASHPAPAHPDPHHVASTEPSLTTTHHTTIHGRRHNHACSPRPLLMSTTPPRPCSPVRSSTWPTTSTTTSGHSNRTRHASAPDIDSAGSTARFRALRPATPSKPHPPGRSHPIMLNFPDVSAPTHPRPSAESASTSTLAFDAHGTTAANDPRKQHADPPRHQRRNARRSASSHRRELNPSAPGV